MQVNDITDLCAKVNFAEENDKVIRGHTLGRAAPSICLRERADNFKSGTRNCHLGCQILLMPTSLQVSSRIISPLSCPVTKGRSTLGSVCKSVLRISLLMEPGCRQRDFR